MIFSEIEKWVNAKVAQHRSSLKQQGITERELILAIEKDEKVSARAMRDFCYAAAFSDVANKMNLNASMFCDEALAFGLLYKEVEAYCENIEVPTQSQITEGMETLTEEERLDFMAKVCHSVRGAAILLQDWKKKSS